MNYEPQISFLNRAGITKKNPCQGRAIFSCEKFHSAFSAETFALQAKGRAFGLKEALSGISFPINALESGLTIRFTSHETLVTKQGELT